MAAIILYTAAEVTLTAWRRILNCSGNQLEFNQLPIKDYSQAFGEILVSIVNTK